jgi:hypothetical protein
MENKIAMQKESGQATVTQEQELANRRIEIEQDLAQKKEQFDRDRFEREKIVSAISAGIAGALEAAKVAANPALAIAVGAFTASQVGFILSQQYPGLATGGTVTNSGRVLVGERGPELLDLPTGASVIPLGSRTGASGVTIIIQAGTVVGEGGADKLAVIISKKIDEQRRLGRL